ncbi:MAG: alkaline phytoceramidase [Pseudomonadota bacterium]
MPDNSKPGFCRNCLDGIRVPLLALVVLGSIICVLLLPPIAQPLSYHDFADQRTLLGVPNGWNVLTNLAFILAGVIGLAGMRAHASLPIVYPVFFAAIVLVGFGSGWYHLNPDNSTLVWDRLPMAIAFMALFAIVIGEYIDVRYGRWLWLPLVLLGMASVGYWHITELAGHGDLRPYGLVQFLPLPLILLLVWLHPDKHHRGRYLLAAFLCIVVSRLTEWFDLPIYEATGFISGHALKHLAAALAVWFIWLWIRTGIDTPRRESCY